MAAASGSLLAKGIGTGTVPALLLHTDARSRLEKGDQIKRVFEVLLGTLYKTFEREYPHQRFEGSRIVAVFGVRKPTIPPRIYWRLASIAERIGEYKNLKEFCKFLPYISQYKVYGLHARWLETKKPLTNDDFKSFDSWLDSFAGIEPADRNTDFLPKIEEAIGQLPEEFVKVNAHRQRIARLFKLCGETYEHNGEKAKAIRTYRQALKHGLKNQRICPSVASEDRAGLGCIELPFSRAYSSWVTVAKRE